MENKELNKPDLETVSGGAVSLGSTNEIDKQMLTRGGKNYAKDILDDVPPGSSAIVLFDE